jgi:hypothetical protein
MNRLTTSKVAKWLEKVIWCELATPKGGIPPIVEVSSAE